ncbi:MAG: hypothetical protein EHM58_10455 [Ignavibacteriae bacterium]|nr:MAG: hypothetical protein EHM58_10455 [Ignavibacteriota bacterium]
MKKLLFAFTVFTLYFIISSSTSYSQSETSMQDILEAVKTKITQLENDKKQEIVNITIDLLVNQGKKTITRALDPNFEYTVLVIGDRRISKLKVSAYIIGKSGKEFTDDAGGVNPSLKIVPDDFDIYEITVGAQDFNGTENAGHFAILIYHGEPLK